MTNKSRGDFGHGGMLSNMLRMSAPMTLALLINVLYNVVDRVYIGHIKSEGALALTGIGLAFPLTVMISAFQNLCSSGGSPIFSMARGREDRAEANKVLGNSYMLLIVFSILLTVTGYIVKAPVLRFAGADESTFVYADQYLSIYLLGTPFVLTSLGMNPFINAQGAATTGMLTVLIGAVINIILDPVFIFVFGMGVRGAALASVIAQACSCVWTHLFLLGKRAEYTIKLSYMKPEPKLIGRILSLGTTGFIAAVTNSAVTMVYNSELSKIGGTVYVTAMTVISSVREVIIMPISGLTSGSQPVLSYNYGAKLYDRVKKGIKLLTISALIYQCFIWGLLMLIPGKFVRVFNGDPDLLNAAADSMRLFFCLTPFFALQMCGQTVFTSLGKTKYAVFFSLLRKAFIVIPLAYILPHLFGLGLNGVFLSEPVSDLLGGGICYVTMMCTVYRKLK